VRVVDKLRERVRPRSPVQLFVVSPRLPFPKAVAILPLVLAAAATGGCGGSSGNGLASKTPSEIIAAARTAATGATAVHVKGSTVAAGTPITLDLNLVVGQGGRGRLSENGLSFELIEIGPKIYINGSTAFYAHFAGASAAQLFHGKWLKASTSNPSFAGLSPLTDMRKLLSAALTAGNSKTLSVAGTATVDGQAAVGVKDTASGTNGTLYVATSGPAYPLEIVKTSAGGGTITFSEWNKPVALTAPAGAVDIEQLQHAG
jgi:hypothetical protein